MIAMLGVWKAGAAFIGVETSYPEERILSGHPHELAALSFDTLSAVLIENPHPDAVVTHGLPDEVFLRADKIPMTKSEVRAVCLSKLRLTADAVCWDVGAGTGSVAVEMALQARKGRVFAIERKPEALTILAENAKRFSLDNLEIVSGSAPDICHGLPAPTHVFIGGGAGVGLSGTLAVILEKNPRARIVATAVTLESCAELTKCLERFPETEVVSLFAARDQKAGPYHLMTGLNPIHIFTLQAGGEKA